MEVSFIQAIFSGFSSSSQQASIVIQMKVLTKRLYVITLCFSFLTLQLLECPVEYVQILINNSICGTLMMYLQKNSTEKAQGEILLQAHWS